MINPVLYFEIPVRNMDRAVSFYEAVLTLKLLREVIDGYEMAFFRAIMRTLEQAARSQRAIFTTHRSTAQ